MGRKLLRGEVEATEQLPQRKAAGDNKPAIKKLGTIDLLMVETTPVVFKDRLYRFEYVRDNYPANKTGASYFRFIDVATGKATPAFANGQHLGCAFVQGDVVYAFSVNKWGGSKITVFRSKDMKKWEEQLALHLPGWELFNTTVCKADGRTCLAGSCSPRSALTRRKSTRLARPCASWTATSTCSTWRPAPARPTRHTSSARRI
jgi:hypothetical protein